MKNQSILLAVESLAPGNGGICRVARLMARSLFREVTAGRLGGVEAVALADTGVDRSLGLPVRVCGGSRGRYVFEVRRALWRHTRVIYDFTGMGRAHAMPVPSRRPSACWIHGIEVWDPVRPDYLAVLRRTGLILSNSSYTRIRAAAANPWLADVPVCWLATEDDEMPLAAPKENWVLIVGRIDAGDRCTWPRYKGHDALIQCWPAICKRVPDARLVIVGDGPGRPQVEALIAASPVRASIEMRGFVAEEELARCFAQARVFAMPSRGEGFGLVYIEAMRHGLPVIASRQDAGIEVNVDGETGYNVDLDTPGELPRRLIELLTDHALAVRLGEAGRKRWREQFQFRSFHDRFVSTLRPWCAASPATGASYGRA